MFVMTEEKFQERCEIIRRKIKELTEELSEGYESMTGTLIL
jgi:hypothetical protein